MILLSFFKSAPNTPSACGGDGLFFRIDPFFSLLLHLRYSCMGFYRCGASFLHCWRNKSAAPFERDNPVQFQHAFLELCSLFSRAKGGQFNPQARGELLKAAKRAISSPCEVTNDSNCPRYFSSQQWMAEMDKLNIERPGDIIDARQEPDPKAVLEGQVDYRSAMGPRYGTYYINYSSDLYLFAVALDYQFHLIKKWLLNHNIGTDLFTDTWSNQNGPLQTGLNALFSLST